MQALRQAGSGVVYALLSIVLVLGSLSVALAERNAGSPAVPTATTAASPVPSATNTTSAVESPQPAATSTAASTARATAVPSSTPKVSYPTTAPTRRVPTSTRAASVPCGPPTGWVKGYVVQPGDSMFHIATIYNTSVATLQRANCKTSFLIFSGERLWVPNVPAPTGVTIIPPFFDTPTDEATIAATQTSLYFTPTVAPTDTGTPDP